MMIEDALVTTLRSVYFSFLLSSSSRLEQILYDVLLSILNEVDVMRDDFERLLSLRGSNARLSRRKEEIHLKNKLNIKTESIFINYSIDSNLL